MDSHGQLITLQFGTVSNWTGAHFWNLQDELQGLADSGADAASAHFDGRVLYDESSSSASSSSSAAKVSTFTPRLLSFDEPDALGPGLLSSSFASSSRALDDEVALAASAATWGGRAVGVPGGGAGAQNSPSAFAAALAAAEREERRRARRGGGARGARPSFDDDDGGGASLASAARALSLSGGVSSWADFLKATLASEGTVHSSKAPGWLPPQPQPQSSSSSSAAALGFVPGARRAGWGPPPPDSQHSIADAVEEGVRRLAERCDRLGGFLTLADDCRGWGSAAAAAAALLRDEYSRTPRLLFALRPPDSLFLRGGPGSSAGGCGKEGDGFPRRRGASASASAAAAAFSTGALAPLVDLFVPLSPPSALWSASSSSSSSSSPCDALFRWSAAAATAIDAATTPLRLRRDGGGGGGGEEQHLAYSSSSSSSSSSLGGFGAASLAALLAGPRGGALAALAAALPLSGIPVSVSGGAGGAAGAEAAAAAAAAAEQQQLRERDGRAKPPSWVSPPAISCWTPLGLEGGGGGGRRALALFAEGSLLAESVTARGALSLQRPPSPARRLAAREAVAALEGALAAEGSRAVRHLCASPAPLHLPLPFPEGMLPRWCYERGGGGGGAARRNGGGGGEQGGLLGGGGAPALVRLAASRALSSLAADSADLLTTGEARASSSPSLSHASGLRSSRADGTSSSLAGSLLPLFESWGLADADGDAAAAAEAARAMAEEYRGGGSDGVLSSGDDDSDDED